ncbi:MAG: Sapep family Mn(2+)-dependent dipeptidase [Bacilli bacterium]|nr:Sapep family Mn(2+)-dependent dipeptidase [Bacilli bacterium]
MPNFKKMAKAYEKDAIKTLQDLVRINSVYDAKTIKEEAPYGAGVKKALDYIAKFGEKNGLSVDRCANRCTELTIGNGGNLIGVYAHADVVPVSGKWDNAPFDAKIIGEGKEAKMIGRGTSDDKGPLVAALYAVKLLKDNNLINDYTVRLVAGGDEERGSSCLEYYFKKLNKKANDYGFTPDADFPLIYAEKGIAHFNATKTIDLKPIIAMDGGVVANAVCDKLIVTMPKDKKFAAFFKESKIDGDINEVGEIMIVSFKGKSAHASTPDVGENAALKAFKILGRFYKIAFLENVAKVLEDVNGNGFGACVESTELGKTTYSYGIIKYAGNAFSMSVDFRFGENVDTKDCIAKFEKATGTTAANYSEMKPLLYDKKSPLVSTLMKSYKRMTWKFFDKPLAIGGGTYAKEAPNCVAYGSAFKGHEGNIHSPNEYIYIEDFLKQIAIYADAIYSLGRIKK